MENKHRCFTVHKILSGVLCLLFFMLAACSVRTDSKEDTKESVKTYYKDVQQKMLPEGFQPYMVSYSQSGMCYVSQSVKEFNNEYITESEVYYQKNDDKSEPYPIATFSSGVVKNVSVNRIDGQTVISILFIDGEQTELIGYTEIGEEVYDIVADAKFQADRNNSQICMLSKEDIILYCQSNIYKLSLDGEIKSTVPVSGYVSSIICKPNGSAYAIHEDTQSGQTTHYISEIDFDRQTLGRKTTIPSGNNCVSVFDENSFATWTDEYIHLFDMNGAEAEPIVDLSKQSILYSQIQNVTQTADGIVVCSMDTDAECKMYRILLSDNPHEDINDKKEEIIYEYAADGRPIVHVAVPSEYRWQIEYYSKKYNQLSSTAFIQIDRFDGSLSDYLGKGNRPDAVMLTDHTEIDEYAKKGILADMRLLYGQQDTYSIDEIVPRVVDLLSKDGKLYGMSGRFGLLLRSSTGEEFDEMGKCTPMEYFRWYDGFLTEKGISGMGELAAVLYADLPYFYDEKSQTADFTGDEFKELMEAFGELSERSGQEPTNDLIADYGYTVFDIFNGPAWYYDLSNKVWFGDETNSMMGMPFMDGTSVDIMSIPYPISVMEYSEFKSDAFDFTLYYCSQAEYIMNGNPTADVGKSYTTCAPFSTFNETLRAEIYETDKPFAVAPGGAGQIKEMHFSNQMLARIEDLIANAQPETKTQKVLFEMLMEEMEYYVAGIKPLDEVCDVLQSRAQSYLYE